MVVFDCMVYLQAAARSTGLSAACLQAVREGRLELVISPETVAEVRDVLTRPRTLRKFPALTVEAVEMFVQDVESRAVTLAEVRRVFSLDRDPKNEPYINLAIASGAAYLATWDQDLLDLMGDEAFRQQFPALNILEPPALLRLLDESTARRIEP
jgi:putative PIN family toxin of toxin-antitoxin system